MIIHEFLEDEKFVGAVHSALRQSIALILEKNMPFAILTDISRVRFSPTLPSEISDHFQPITLFELDGYTLDSSGLNNDILSFEAGFGDSDFASSVSIPLGAVLQVIVNETPIFLNMSISSDNKKDEVVTSIEDKKKRGAKRSREALFNNPENKRLIKK